MGEVSQALPETQQSYAAAGLAVEQSIRQQFTERFLGVVGLHAAVATERPDAEGPTLAYSIDHAHENPEANALVDVNVASAVAEGCISDNYYTRTIKEVGPDGLIKQFGLTHHQMHYNSYALRSGRHTLLRRFTLAEGLNGYREQRYYEEGLLNDAILLVASCVPGGSPAETVPEELLDHRGDGFFTRSMTFALQATTAEGDKVVTESVFRRGTAASEDASYSERQAKRYDIEAIGMVYEWLGHKVPKTALEFLQNPLLLAKSEFPNGALDFLRLCDIASDVLQNRTGERTRDEYQDLIIESAKIDASLAGVRAAVKADLLAAAGTFEQHEDANHRLWELVRQHGSRDAVDNRTISPEVFGPHAKARIMRARNAADEGDFILRDSLRATIPDVAVVTGCGGGSCGLEKVDRSGAEGAAVSAGLKAETGDVIVRYPGGRCVNPKCEIKGQVYYAYNPDNPARGFNAFCMGCKVADINGKRQES